MDDKLDIHHPDTIQTEEGQDFLNRAEKILVQLDTLESHYLTSEKRGNL